jgi:hypothetical protein
LKQNILIVTQILQKRLGAFVLVFSSGSIKKATGGFKNLHSEKLATKYYWDQIKDVCSYSL